MQRQPTPRAAVQSPSPSKTRTAELTTTASTGVCQFEACTQSRLASFDYCNRHILHDRNAPFKQCAYVYNSTGKRCLGSAPKGEKRDGYCAEHLRKATAMRLRASRQKAPPETADSLLNSLSHYQPSQQNKIINPFEDIDAAKLNGGMARVLDLASDSDSEPGEGGAVTLETAWSGDSESEGDSADSELEDPLRHAGFYTEEEAVYQARDRLRRLQSLYMREFRSLQFRLREQRRLYLVALKREKESLMSIHQQPKNTPQELTAYLKLKALNHYRKHSGVEAVLHKKAKDRKLQAIAGSNANRQAHATKCSYTEGGVKCGDKALPLTKLCQKHILNDSHQLLFRSCGVARAELPPCEEPVLAVFPHPTCLCHTGVSPVKVNTEEDVTINPEREDSVEMTVNLQPNSINEFMKSDIMESMDMNVDVAEVSVSATDISDSQQLVETARVSPSTLLPPCVQQSSPISVLPPLKSDNDTTISTNESVLSINGVGTSELL